MPLMLLVPLLKSNLFKFRNQIFRKIKFSKAVQVLTAMVISKILKLQFQEVSRAKLHLKQMCWYWATTLSKFLMEYRFIWFPTIWTNKRLGSCFGRINGRSLWESIGNMENSWRNTWSWTKPQLRYGMKAKENGRMLA